MKRLFSKRTVLIALLALGWSGLAMAAQSKAEAPDSHASRMPDPHALGLTEATLDYCAKADPIGAARVRSHLKQLVRGASRESIAEARKSDEYQKAHRSADDFLAQVDEHNARKVCAGRVAIGK